MPGFTLDKAHFLGLGDRKLLIAVIVAVRDSGTRPLELFP
jgi:hypothetical protein